MKRAFFIFVGVFLSWTLSAQKQIALTFDDGPTDTTPLVLEILKKYDIPATFFVLGHNIREDSEWMVRKAYEMGCEIENHSYNHHKMDTLSRKSVMSEIRSTDKKIKAITGSKSRYFRPPYGAYNQMMCKSIRKPFIMGVWVMDSRKNVPSTYRAWKAVKEANDGMILLMHDFAGNTPTVEALDVIIPELQKQGYSFVTLEHLFKSNNIRPVRGWLYTNVFQSTPTVTVGQEFVEGKW